MRGPGRYAAKRGTQPNAHGACAAPPTNCHLWQPARAITPAVRAPSDPQTHPECLLLPAPRPQRAPAPPAASMAFCPTTGSHGFFATLLALLQVRRRPPLEVCARAATGRPRARFHARTELPRGVSTSQSPNWRGGAGRWSPTNPRRRRGAAAAAERWDGAAPAGRPAARNLLLTQPPPLPPQIALSIAIAVTVSEALWTYKSWSWSPRWVLQRRRWFKAHAQRQGPCWTALSALSGRGRALSWRAGPAHGLPPCAPLPPPL